MLVVNPALEHNTMVLAESCIKAKAPGRPGQLHLNDLHHDLSLARSLLCPLWAPCDEHDRQTQDARQSSTQQGFFKSK